MFRFESVFGGSHSTISERGCAMVEYHTGQERIYRLPLPFQAPFQPVLVRWVLINDVMGSCHCTPEI